MKIFKFILRFIGLCFFVAGLFYFLDAVNSISVTSNLSAILLRFVNGVAWLVAGFGLLRLQSWSLQAIAGLNLLYLFTILFNWYVSGIAPSDMSRSGIRPLGFLIILLFSVFAKRDQLFDSRSHQEKK